MINANTNSNKSPDHCISGKRKATSLGELGNIVNEFQAKKGSKLKFRKGRSLDSESEETIYKDAVPQKNRISSSSDEVDTSDELINLPFEGLTVMDNSVIADNLNPSEGYHPVRNEDFGCDGGRSSKEGDQLMQNSPQLSSSRGQDQYHRNRPREVTPEDKAKQIIRNAELTKEQLLPKTGKNFFDYSAAVIVETFFVVGSNLDLATIEKIQKGDYVDFGKLVPKDRVLVEEDQRLEIVIRNGRTFYVPVLDSTTISNFQRWEQAFRVYANLYTKKHSHRSSELIEYNQIIHTASLNYMWDNIYLYDKDFRLHMACNLECNWGVILQQSWFFKAEG